MNTRFQAKTLVRLFLVVVVASIVSTLLVGPRADAASDGYGISTVALADDLALVTEGRSVSMTPELR